MHSEGVIRLWTYLYNIETDVLIEGVQDEFTQTAITPGTMD